ncbi:MAG TPA: chemotaxis protein CheB [Thermomicrobiaceae bacterium]|nr:chemotaxis protein CheB [Thermomicrobiaceae bacterium]
MSGHDIITIGASAGGVEALIRLVEGLPFDLPAALFVVLHFPPTSTSYLPEILQRAGTLPAAQARDLEPIVPGRIYVAPPDRHLIVERERMRLTWGPKENRHRPAVDPLFRSAAIAYGPRVVGVVLSGMDGDGTAGLRAIAQRGGVTVVQDPADAIFPSMPESALAYVEVDYRLPARALGGLLAELAHSPVPREDAYPVPEMLRLEHRQMMGELETFDMNQFGRLTSLTCPECSGPIWELHEGELVRYRCRVGHTFLTDDMIEARSEQIEQQLWAAINQLEENEALALRLAENARSRGYARAAASFEEKATAARERAALLRRALLREDAGETA